MSYPDIPIVVTYETLRRLDNRLRRIEEAVTKDADNEAEIVTLREQNEELRATVKALQDEMQDATGKLKASTDNLAGAVAANTPAP